MSGGEDYFFLVFVSPAIYESANSLFYFFGYAGFGEGEDGGEMCDFGQQAGFGDVYFGGCCQLHCGPKANFSFNGFDGLFPVDI